MLTHTSPDSTTPTTNRVITGALSEDRCGRVNINVSSPQLRDTADTPDSPSTNQFAAVRRSPRLGAAAPVTSVFKPVAEVRDCGFFFTLSLCSLTKG